MTSQSPSFTTQGPSSVVSYGRLSAVPAPSYSQKVAAQVIEAEAWLVGIGDGFGLDLSAESCELCGGFFPAQGNAVMYLSEMGEPLYLHTGCLREVENWA